MRIREDSWRFLHDFRLRDAELSDGEIPVLAAENQDIVPHNYYTVSQRVPSNLDTAVPGAAPALRYRIEPEI